MNGVTRKQREILLRQELILAISKELFVKHGYYKVTMDMIAQHTEYAKGTIYQLFDCKECVCFSLYIKFSELMLSIVNYIKAEKSLTPIQQIYCIRDSFIMLHEQCSDDFSIKQLVSSKLFYSKISSEVVNRSILTNQRIFKAISSIINRAVLEKHLPETLTHQIEHIVLGFWTLINHFDTLNNSVSYEKSLIENTTLYLKGLEWKDEKNSKNNLLIISKSKLNINLLIKEYLSNNRTL